MTIEAFRDFDLTFDWKVASGANSGVKYNVSEEMSMKSANHAALGFEYQVLDDALNRDNKSPSHRAGSLYDLIPAANLRDLEDVPKEVLKGMKVRGIESVQEAIKRAFAPAR